MGHQRCRCETHKCNGALVAEHIFRAHQRSDLLRKTTVSQTHFRRAGERFVLRATQDPGPVARSFSVPLEDPQPPISPNVEFHDPPRMSESPVEQEMLDCGFLTGEDLDIMTHGHALPNLGPNFHSPEALLFAVDHFGAYNRATAAGSRPLTANDAHHLQPDPEQRQFEHDLSNTIEEMQHKEVPLLDENEDDDLHQIDIDVDALDEDGDNEMMGPGVDLDVNEDDPDPFMLDEGFSSTDNSNLVDVPPHLITIYALVSWLHLQFHLPRVACNALLTIFGLILVYLSPAIEVPFVTLQSSNRVLGVDKDVLTLPVCPTCRDVFPPAMSTKCHDTCMTCAVDLFLLNTTKRGNLRAMKTPIIKYPYLPLSEQIMSLLKIPGLEAVLDGWCSKPRTVGTYTDIFDGAVCRTKLKSPDGNLFFSNFPHEKNGPNGELRIGVNLGVDW